MPVGLTTPHRAGIPWSPEAIIELVGQHGPVLQDTARQITARVT
jgi:hypothetical protein